MPSTYVHTYESNKNERKSKLPEQISIYQKHYLSFLLAKKSREKKRARRNKKKLQGHLYTEILQILVCLLWFSKSGKGASNFYICRRRPRKHNPLPPITDCMTDRSPALLFSFFSLFLSFPFHFQGVEPSSP